MSTPGQFNFGNNLDGFEPTLTREGYYRTVEKLGHPVDWKPHHYRPHGRQNDHADGPSLGGGVRAARLRSYTS